MTITVDTSTHERLVEEWARLWSCHDLDSLLQLFTDDVVYEDVALGVVNRGKDAVRVFASRFLTAFPDVTL
jgi:ketosteroid isomerase-like protein